MKIFISHSSHDKWVARQISRLLESDGHETFLDEKDIQTGDSIDASIQTHLKDSDHLILLISPASITSHWVFIELGGAKALGKRVIPILFHVGANEIPAAVSQLLARDINDFDRYLAEIKSQAKTGEGPSTKARRGRPRAKKESATAITGAVSHLNVGDKVRIVNVERLTPGDKAKNPTWIPEMDKYSGVETHVLEVDEEGDVRLAADEGFFAWSPTWLSKLG